MAFAAASSNTGLWQYDVATRQLWATDHCRSMFGLDAGPLAPARFMRAVHPDDRRLAAAAVRSAIHGGQTVARISCCPRERANTLAFGIGAELSSTRTASRSG